MVEIKSSKKFSPVSIRYIISMLISDILAIVLAISIAFLLKFGISISEFEIRLREMLIIIFFVITIFFLKRLYTQRRLFYEESKEIIESLFYAFILIFSVYAMTKAKPDFSRLFLGLSIFFSIFIVPIFRLITKKILNGYLKEKILVIEGPESDKIYNFFKSEWYLAYEPVGIIKLFEVDKYKDEVSNVVIPRIPFLNEFYHDISSLCLKFKKVFYVPDISGLSFTNQILHFSISQNLPIFETSTKFDSQINLIIKRMFDIIFSLLVIVLLSPLYLIIAMLVKLTSRGPVFYKHKRIGKNGEVIEIYKFRTMYKNADEILRKLLEQNSALREEWEKNYKLKNDPRITPIGKFLRKFSLDELPQFLNVLKGDLSVVGPRPVVKEELEKYYGDYKKFYLAVKPGITGLWQVSGRSNTTYEDRVKLDTIYVVNWSLWLDIVIILKTIGVVLKNEGAY
ncbi:MAG: exopolysaccharide biosynthesis polyprenyl glycosylphosphotransferase [candidate division WOR-3 bacterium]|nr:exopolysaccharide biosynthesis polyprenyl glycosylphosphotransferase [candidate division WOR-3 bacterium]MDW8150540.1 exopolysaccharide biosynthesis polyprenyl glycosylphosphotransferase [candidate division WOR-3 bacterium]